MKQTTKKRRLPYIFYSILLAAVLVVGASVFGGAVTLTNTDGYINISSCVNVTNGTCIINYNTTRYASSTLDGILSKTDWTRFNTSTSSNSSSGGSGNITGVSNTSTDYVAVFSNTTQIIQRPLRIDSAGNAFVTRDLRLSNTEGGDSALFLNGTGDYAIYFLTAGRTRWDGGGSLIELHNINNRVYFTGEGNPVLDLYSDTNHRKLVISNDGTANASLEVDNEIISKGKILTPELCLNNDCRTTWPSTGEGAAILPWNPQIYYKSYDFESVTAGYGSPWVPTAVSAGTTALIIGNESRPGIATISSSTTSNSGYAYQITGATTYLLNPGLVSTAVLAPLPTTTNINNTCRVGFQDVFTITTPVDGAYWNITQHNATVFNATPVTRSNNAETRGSIVQFAVNVNQYYRPEVWVANDTNVVFTLYNSTNQVVVNTQNITSNVPVTAGRETSHAIICFMRGFATAQVLAHLDYVGVYDNLTISR